MGTQSVETLNTAGPQWSKDRMLAAVQASPAAVARHDRRTWLDLFAPAAVVQDPVGTRACRSTNEIAAFYDTFIAASEITFHVDHDYFCGDSVLRDVTVHTQMDTGIEIEVPMHLLYRLQEQNGELKFAELSAYWELRAMIPQVLGQGLVGFRTMLALSIRMLKNQGLGATIAYSDGLLKGIFKTGKQDVEALVGYLGGKNVDLGLRLDQPDVALPAPFGEKVVGRKVISAGYSTTFSFECGGATGAGIVDYNRETKKIARVRVFS